MQAKPDECPMNKLRAFWTRLINTLCRTPFSKDFTDELETHVAMDTERGIRNGLSPEEARRQALIRLGVLRRRMTLTRNVRGCPGLNPCSAMSTTVCGLSCGTAS